MEIIKNMEQSIEELKGTKSSLEAQIESEEAEKIRLQHEVERMTSRISQLNESLGKKMAARTDYERTIQETESAFMKILESSQLLLNMVKREAACLDQTLNSSSSNVTGSNGAQNETSPVKGKGVGLVGKETALIDCDVAVGCHKVAGAADHIRKKRSAET